jgi:hypothetical protein
MVRVEVVPFLCGDDSSIDNMADGHRRWKLLVNPYWRLKVKGGKN